MSTLSRRRTHRHRRRASTLLFLSATAENRAALLRLSTVSMSVCQHVSVCLSVYLHVSVCLSVYHEACNVCTGSCYPENNILLLLSIFVI